MANVHHDPVQDVAEKKPVEAGRSQEKAAGKFQFCWTGVGLGLLAVVLTTPIWGIFTSGIISWIVPIAAFAIVMQKVCTVPASENENDDKQ